MKRYSCAALAVATIAVSFCFGCASSREPMEVAPPPEAVMPPDPSMPPVEIVSATPEPAVVPALTETVVAPTVPETAVAPTATPTPATRAYSVQEGDSLSLIAARHGLTTHELAALNSLTNPNRLRVGQELKLPVNATERPVQPRHKGPAVAMEGEYIIQRGDTLSGLAVKFGTTTAALKKSNGLSSDMLREGRKLKVPSNATRTPPPAAPIADQVQQPPTPMPAPVHEAVPPVADAVPPAPQVDPAPPAEAAPAPQTPAGTPTVQ